MKLDFHGSIVHARQVLNHIRKIKGNQKISVSHWSNCREQGFHLSYLGEVSDYRNPPWRCVNVAECRNSDSIVVFFGDVGDFDITHHQMSDEVWRNNRRSFDPGKEKQAAKEIVDFLIHGKPIKVKVVMAG